MTPDEGIHRDAWGIPRVVAPTVERLAYLQGVAVAEDRAWQVEHSRLRSLGRTATALGERGLAWDRFARRVQVDALARSAYAALDPESARFVASFVDGVNDGLGAVGEVAELRAVGLSPGRWEPWTPLGVFAAQHVLFSTFPTKLWRGMLHEVLGPDAAGLFNVEGVWSAGSNCWAVGAERTAGGRPMIAGDTHRAFEAPNCYAQVRLTCTAADGGFDVAGFTFPGVPGVQHFAHAGTVAWGITNAMADYQDVYVERLDRRGDGVWAEGPEGWERCTGHREEVEVRGGATETVEVVVTGNGPVFHGGPGEPLSLSLRTASYALGDLGFGALLPLLRSRTAADVEAALARWVEPVNNLVVADDGGEVRQRVVGRVPDRAEENRWRPVPGWDAAHRWRGWLDRLPAGAVAADGQVVTANHRMSADFDRVGVEFSPPARAERIGALLSGRSGLTRADFAAVHRDDLLPQPAVLVEAVAGLSGLTGPARGLQREIAGWDQRMRADSPTAAAYAAVREALVARLAAAPPFSALPAGSPYGPLFDAWFLTPLQLSLSLPTLLSPRGHRLVPGLDRHLAAAVEEVAARGRDPWGERHRYRPLHALGHRLPDAPGLSGDNDCVLATGTMPGSDTSVRGPVARYVWDLAGLDRSGWVVPLGASGDPAGPHHHDQLSAWVAGDLVPLEAEH